jgi:hypothetical protein
MMKISYKNDVNIEVCTLWFMYKYKFAREDETFNFTVDLSRWEDETFNFTVDLSRLEDETFNSFFGDLISWKMKHSGSMYQSLCNGTAV